VTEQLVGESWLNAPPFRYCGNIGPIDVPSALREDLTRIGHVVATECRLRGLLGVDFILADGRPWLVEVNPRYTASVEVLELATGANAIHRHAAAFVDGGGSEQSPPWGPFVGKAILYTPRPFTFRAPPQPNDSDHRYADVPVRGEEILAGWPVLTVLCRGQSPEDVRRGLQSHAAKVQVDCEAI
jgi:predicted ATP-grasp superfamily ATP-dependent carboligase